MPSDVQPHRIALYDEDMDLIETSLRQYASSRRIPEEKRERARRLIARFLDRSPGNPNMSQYGRATKPEQR